MATRGFSTGMEARSINERFLTADAIETRSPPSNVPGRQDASTVLEALPKSTQNHLKAGAPPLLATHSTRDWPYEPHA